MDYKVSVIIPVYNAEKNLENAIKSVIKQTIGFKNIELILVDDNSSDNSKNIIKSYSDKYSNIKYYFSQENHGFPGFGRNMGLELATSDYIMFLDNDDEYKEDICETLYNTITTKNVDYVGCNKITVDSFSNIKQHLKYKNGKEHENYVLIKNDNILFFDSTAVWSKIFKKRIIEKNNLKFLENTHADDLAFTLDYSLNINTLIYLKNYHGIYWKVYNDSLSHTVTQDFITQLLDTFYYMYDSLKNKNKEKYVNSYFSNKISYLILQCSYLNSNNKEFKQILEYIRIFEEHSNFTINLDEKWINTVNKLILKKKYNTSIIILKSIKKIRNIRFLRKIIRQLKMSFNLI